MATLYLVAAIRKAFAREEPLAKPGLGSAYGMRLQQRIRDAQQRRQAIIGPSPAREPAPARWEPPSGPDGGDDPAHTMRVSRLNLRTGEHQHTANEDLTHGELAERYGEPPEQADRREPWVHLSRRSPRSAFAWEAPELYLEGDRRANRRLMLRRLSPRTPILAYTWSSAIDADNRLGAYADTARHLLRQGFHPGAVFLDKHGDVPQTTLGELAARPERYLGER
jgi:hypothetical protein